MEVSPHTALKHRILGVYFLICRQVMKNRKLIYVDLYCGDGECNCDKTELKKWDCPFIKSLLKKAKAGELNLECYLNDINHNNFLKLKDKVKDYDSFVKEITNKDANIIHEHFLKKIDPSDWSIFFLDPYKHNQLDWKTIVNISNYESFDTRSRCKRKPELIINLMTLTMQRTMKHDPDSITRALGTEEWKMEVKNREKEKVHEIFLEIFIKQLKKLGYSTTTFFIEQTPPLSNVLYYLIFASSIPSADDILKKRFKPYIDKIMKEEWVKENFKFKMIAEARGKGDRSIEDFIKPKN